MQKRTETPPAISVLTPKLLKRILVGESSTTGRPILPATHRWLAATVCRSWYTIIRAAKANGRPAHTGCNLPLRARQGRIIYASSVVEILERRDLNSDELHSVFCGVTTD